MRAWGVVPVDLGAGIALGLPGGDFLDQSLLIGNAPIEAVGRQDAEASEQIFSRRRPRYLNRSALRLGNIFSAGLTCGQGL